MSTPTTTWAGHYHGFGPWTGPRAQFAVEGLRRPGPVPANEQTRAFLTNTMTPVQTGLSLLRVDQAAAGRTWTHVEDALTWVAKTWAQHPPGGDELPLDTRIAYDRDLLRLGNDICAGYYTPGLTFVSFSVVCCPNRFFPHIRCPLPPGGAGARKDPHVAAPATSRPGR